MSTKTENKPLSDKQLRQQYFARKRWKIMTLLGTTHFAEKGLLDLIGTDAEQEFFAVQAALNRLRVKLNKELAKQKLQQQVEISREKADAET